MVKLSQGMFLCCILNCLFGGEKTNGNAVADRHFSFNKHVDTSYHVGYDGKRYAQHGQRIKGLEMQRRPYNNPWDYPPTIVEFEEDVERFRRRQP